MYYAASTTICCAHAISDGGRLVLGAQAGEARLAEVFRKAGFTRFRRARETPFNLILEARLCLQSRTARSGRHRQSKSDSDQGSSDVFCTGRAAARRQAPPGGPMAPAGRGSADK